MNNEIAWLFGDLKWLYALLQICGAAWWCALAGLFVVKVGAQLRAHRNGQGQ